MSTGAPDIRIAAEADVDALAAFMQAQGQAGITAAYLRHWYFHAPVAGSTVVIGAREGRIVGVATMTMHRFQREGRQALVAMPQKVLTDAAERGRGVFGKLYRACEQACLERGADLFVTVTNAASTPIFLGPFGFVRLPAPRMAILPALPGRADVRPLRELTPRVDVAATSRWRMHKDAAHDRWRFLENPDRGYTMVRCTREGEEVGAAYVKRARKKGLPVLLVLDMVAHDPDHAGALLRVIRKLAWAQRCVAVLVLEEASSRPAIAQAWPVFHLSSGFNLLVKGHDAAHTAALAREGVELAFGDLDFF